MSMNHLICLAQEENCRFADRGSLTNSLVLPATHHGPSSGGKRGIGAFLFRRCAGGGGLISP